MLHSTAASARLRAAIFILSHALPSPAKERRATPNLPKSIQNPDFMHKNAQIPQQPFRRPDPKTGRNDPCPRGSGRKFKQCCLNKPRTAVA
jgi:hypothetical protein